MNTFTLLDPVGIVWLVESRLALTAGYLPFSTTVLLEANSERRHASYFDRDPLLVRITMH